MQFHIHDQQTVKRGVQGNIFGRISFELWAPQVPLMNCSPSALRASGKQFRQVYCIIILEVKSQICNLCLHKKSKFTIQLLLYICVFHWSCAGQVVQITDVQTVNLC